MIESHFINILYNLAVSSSREIHFQPLVTKTLQRMMNHMDFPCGMLYVRGEADSDEIYQLAAAIGDVSAVEKVGSSLEIPSSLADRLQVKADSNSDLISILPCRQGYYKTLLQFPVPETGWMFLLSPRNVRFDFPMDVMFLPFLANFGIAIRLSRKNDEYMETLERTVNERTHELKRSNERLRAEADERKKAQLALQYSEEQLRNIFDNLQDAFVRCDASGNITKCSPSALNLIKCDNLVGENVIKFSASAETSRSFLKELRAKKGHLDNFKIKLRRTDRKVIWVSVSVRALYDASGKFTGIEGTGRDVTESIKAQENLSRYSKKVAQLLVEKERLSRELILAQENERRELARELHDQTGQALTVISTSASIIASTTDNEEIMKCADNIIDCVSNVMQDIREVSKRLRPYLLDSMGLVAAVEELVKNSRGMTKADVRISTSGNFRRIPDIVSVVIFRVIQESLTNAVRYSNAGCISVMLRSVPRTSGRAAKVEMEVNDNGEGINLGKTDHSGLGLIGMRERVTAVNGELEIRSKAGGGTSIWVQIPLQ